MFAIHTDIILAIKVLLVRFVVLVIYLAFFNKFFIKFFCFEVFFTARTTAHLQYNNNPAAQKQLVVYPQMRLDESGTIFCII